MDIEIGQWLYCFMGERLINFEVVEIIDNLRLIGEDDDCTYTFYMSYCYLTREAAIEGMIRALEVHGEMRVLTVKGDDVTATECDCGESDQMLERLLYAASRKYAW